MKADIYQQVTDSIIAIIEAGKQGNGISWAQEAAKGTPCASLNFERVRANEHELGFSAPVRRRDRTGKA